MSTSTAENLTAQPADRLAGKYLTFRLDEASYGIRVLQVREILRPSGIVAVPQLPPWIRGVINLRGRVIPVIDLRVRLGLPRAADTAQTCIIVVEVRPPGRPPRAVGTLVDGVEEVAQIAAADATDTPEFGAQVDTAFLLGMAKTKGGVKSLLDLDRVLGSE